MGSLVLRMRVCPVLMVEMLSVPKNMKLLAVPLFELYDNTARYGPQLSVPSPRPCPFSPPPGPWPLSPLPRPLSSPSVPCVTPLFPRLSLQQAIPHLLSRYNFEFLDEEDNVICRTPAKDVDAPHAIPNVKAEVE